MILHFAITDWSIVLPVLLRVWPEQNARWTKTGAKLLGKVVKRYGKTENHSTVAVNTAVGKNELQQFGRRVAVTYSTPWRFKEFLKPNMPISKQALKLRPGSELGISIEGHPTTARVDTIRRVRFRGKWTYLKMGLIVNTETLPFFLERETKCDCKYCGQTTKDPEAVSCQFCGSPLDVDC